jgi:molybdopterin-guanine dinucleotide biosynthesis protein
MAPNSEPDLADRVAAVSKDLDEGEFDTRERAQKRLEDMGRAAFVHLKRMREQVKSPEMQRRLDELLDRHDAAKAIDR